MIEIRTLDELRAGRTVIRITVGSRPDADLSPTTAANVLDQAERAGKVPALERQVTELRNELARVTGELIDTQHELARRTDERNGREAARAKLERELATARASEIAPERLAERNAKIESLETKLGLAHADRANLKREVTRLEGELDAASRLAQSADTRRATAELRAEQAAADLDAATGYLLLRDGELASANDQRDAERSRAEQNRAWAERAEGHLATARASLMRTRHELETANDNFLTSQNRVKELEAANASLVAEAGERQADPGTRLYTAAEVEDAQTSEAELVTAPLNARIQAQEGQLGSLRVTLTAAGVSTALGQVTPGTPGDVLARAVRLARMTLAIKN